MKLGTTELLVILAIVIIVFGPSQIPKLAKMFGKSAKNLRDGLKDGEDDASVHQAAQDNDHNEN